MNPGSSTVRGLYWKARIVLLSLRWVFKFNIGDDVIYQGRRWMLIQGVGAPIWSLTADGERVDAHQNDFRKVRSLPNYLRSFRSGYRFYMGYWYSIWMREGIQPWMRGCNIWGRGK